MIFRQLFDSDSSTYTYLIADEDTREAILVDPVLEQLNRDLSLLTELGLSLKYSLDTHVHADHITAIGKLRENSQCASIYPEGSGASCVDREIHDGETIQLGKVKLRAIATPGHTDSHMAYLINDDRILTGDVLFIRGCGRTDFQNGCAENLYDSVIEKLFKLPGATLVYPGHDYKGMTVSSIAEEISFNPRFVGKTKEEFVKFMGELNLPNPKRMMEAVPANQNCGRAEINFKSS